MSELTVCGISIGIWFNVLMLFLVFHFYIGIPNILYLCTVYKNFVLSWKRGKLKALEISTLNSRAYLTWIDDNIHMNNGAYFSQFEKGRRDWLYRIGSSQFYKLTNCKFVLTGLTARFRKEIQPLDTFQIETRLIYYDELNIYLEQRILCKEMVCCVAYAQCSIIHKQTIKRTNTNNFIKFLQMTDNEKPKITKNAPLSLLHWIDYLRNSSSELRMESGLSPTKTKKIN
eukprot:2110_1